MYINEQHNNYKNNNIETSQNYTKAKIKNLTNKINLSNIDKLKETTIINIPTFFNLSKYFIHLYFYVALFNIILITVSMLNNNFKYLYIMIFLIIFLLVISSINKTKLIIDHKEIVFKKNKIKLNEIKDIKKGKYFKLYNYIDIFKKGKVKPIRIFLKDEDDSTNISALKYY